jgi:hypothetical protein
LGEEGIGAIAAQLGVPILALLILTSLNLSDPYLVGANCATRRGDGRLGAVRGPAGRLQQQRAAGEPHLGVQRRLWWELASGQPRLVHVPKDNYVSHNMTDQSSVVKFIEDNWLKGERIGQGSFDAKAGSLDAPGGVLDFHAFPNYFPLLLNPTTGEPLFPRL